MLTHRLQILLDEERYERVADVARHRKMSVAAVIREAIDTGLPSPSLRKAAAIRRVLDAPDMPVPSDPGEVKKEIYEDRMGRFE